MSTTRGSGGSCTGSAPWGTRVLGREPRALYPNNVHCMAALCTTGVAARRRRYILRDTPFKPSCRRVDLHSAPPQRARAWKAS